MEMFGGRYYYMLGLVSVELAAENHLCNIGLMDMRMADENY